MYLRVFVRLLAVLVCTHEGLAERGLEVVVGVGAVA